MNTKKYTQSSFFIFTLIYLIFASMLILRCIHEQSFALAGTDGLNVYYPFMVYISRYIREFVQGMFNGQINLPLVDFRVGMGEDLIQSLNWIGFGDPFYLLAVFFDDKTIPWFYTVLFYLRVYLGGMTFILLSKELLPNKSVWAYVTGAFLYCFSGFGFEANVHIIFVHAMMYIPLMLYGTERILSVKHGGKRILVITTFMFGLTGFFFTYIGVLATGLYAVVMGGV